MKLKYYLRGLAVGVILTTIILTIADDKPMTDAQVRQRALELGMIEGDSLKLTDVGVGGEKEQLDASTESEQSSAEYENTVESSIATQESSSEAEASSDTATHEGKITFTIVKGESSNSICRALAEAGLIDDAIAFDDYLCANGYSRKIRAGTYEMLPGMSYEEITKMITK